MSTTTVPVIAAAELTPAALGDLIHRLHHGGLVALPTETVYGLAADAANPQAVARIYAVKGRPADHPVIVHLGGIDELDHWARGIPRYARSLATAGWPGPLTLVLRRAAGVGDHVTGGQDTIGLRVPAHPVALTVLRAFGGGLAAPSANRFGRVSPTSAPHVVAELGPLLDPRRDAVLDAGACRVGVESTIVDCTGGLPRMLRPGGFSAAAVAEITGLPLTAGRRAAQRAPGTLVSHYRPRAAVVLTEDPASVVSLVAGLPGPVGLLALAPIPTPPGVHRLAAPIDVGDYARTLYAALRAGDDQSLATLVAVLPLTEAVGVDSLAAAIRDRLTRAAHR